MNMLAILLAIIIVVVVILLIYWYTSSSSMVSHTVVWKSLGEDEEKEIYKGSSIPLISSDGVENVLIATPNGIFLSTISRKTPIKINSSIATGIAFDGTGFMMIEADSTFSTISLDGTKTEIGNGYTKLYDTIDGYFTKVGNVSSVTGRSGSTSPAKGDYGLIQLEIK